MLTEAEIRALKARAASYTKADGKGLHLLVSTTGRKTWYYRYERKVAGENPGDPPKKKDTEILVGEWPGVTGWDARRIRDNMKLMRKSGADPVETRRIEQTPVVEAAKDMGRPVREVAAQILAEQRPTGDFDADHRAGRWSLVHYERTKSAMETYLYPHKLADGTLLGDTGVKGVSAGTFVHLVRHLQGKRADGKEYARETPRKAAMHLRMVMNRAVIDGEVDTNPGLGLRGLIKETPTTPLKSLPPHQLGEFLRRLDGMKIEPVTRLGIQLMVHIFVRTKELRNATWPEFDLKEQVWRIPWQRMKNRLPFDVPLSNQVVAILTTLHGVTGHQKYVLGTPWKKSRDSMVTLEQPISANTMQDTVRKRMGYQVTVHGFRATARTVFSQNGWSRGAGEKQLSHRERNKVVRTYDRADHWPERVAMMAWWSSWIEAVHKNAPPPKGPGAWIRFVDDLASADED